jgi:hypothetical protein
MTESLAAGPGKEAEDDPAEGSDPDWSGEQPKVKAAMNSAADIKTHFFFMFPYLVSS